MFYEQQDRDRPIALHSLSPSLTPNWISRLKNHNASTTYGNCCCWFTKALSNKVLFLFRISNLICRCAICLNTEQIIHCSLSACKHNAANFECCCINIKCILKRPRRNVKFRLRSCNLISVCSDLLKLHSNTCTKSVDFYIVFTYLRSSDVTKFRIHGHQVHAAMLWDKLRLVFESTSLTRRSNRLALLGSKLSLQILQQQRIILMSLTTCCPTTWSRQQWQ